MTPCSPRCADTGSRTLPVTRSATGPRRTTAACCFPDRPLTVSEISELQLDADLAYLSACDTMDVPPTLVDEAMHISGAFQFAGYRHVVGTLWPVSDEGAMAMATSVYGRLTMEGSRAPDVGGTALAVHEATRRLRADRLGTPTWWAGFVHVGG